MAMELLGCGFKKPFSTLKVRHELPSRCVSLGESYSMDLETAVGVDLDLSNPKALYGLSPFAAVTLPKLNIPGIGSLRFTVQYGQRSVRMVMDTSLRNEVMVVGAAATLMAGSIPISTQFKYKNVGLEVSASASNRTPFIKDKSFSFSMQELNPMLYL